MLTDSQGLDVTTDSPVTLTAINHFIDQSLRYGRDAEAVILAGIAADPTCAIAHAYAAAYYLALEHAVAWSQALPYVKTAQQSAAGATLREQLYIEAIAAWSAKATDHAIALHEAIAEQFPQDVVSVQQGQYHYFYQGEKVRLLAIAERVLPANRDHHYLYGMTAFGLEQCHRLAEAETMAYRAIDLNRQDPWAHHAVAHIMDTQGRIDEGIAWMERFADTWESCNSMLYTHNWWHIALFYLAKGELQRVLQLYDIHIWGRARRATPKDQVGAIALLLQLELQNVPVEKRWEQLTTYLYPRLHEHALAFQDLHYIYALARTQKIEWLQDMVDSLNQQTEALNSPNRQIWSDIVLPATHGLIAHAQGDWSGAIAQLKPVLSHLWKLGGSHTQHKLFKQIYQNALFHEERSKKTVSFPKRQHHSVAPMTSYPASKAVS